MLYCFTDHKTHLYGASIGFVDPENVDARWKCGSGIFRHESQHLNCEIQNFLLHILPSRMLGYDTGKY